MRARRCKLHKRFDRSGPGRGRLRRGGVIVCVLVVLMLVTLLTIQTMQTLFVIRRGDDERSKIYQARELIELGRWVDWSEANSQSLQVQIPDTATEAADVPARLAKIERQKDANKTDSKTRLVVRYPADEPGEVTTTWDDENE